MKYLFLFSLLLSGCMSQTKIDRILSTCPDHVQQNVGEIKYMPISWGTAMGICGVTDKNTGEIWLTAWANEHTVLHEIGHSVYFRTPHERFDKDFKEAGGFISVWSLSHNEAIAEAFVAGMEGKHNDRIDCAMRFFEGENNE